MFCFEKFLIYIGGKRNVREGLRREGDVDYVIKDEWEWFEKEDRMIFCGKSYLSKGIEELKGRCVIKEME